jgi:hypothetical protein
VQELAQESERVLATESVKAPALVTVTALALEPELARDWEPGHHPRRQASAVESGR